MDEDDILELIQDMNLDGNIDWFDHLLHDDLLQEEEHEDKPQNFIDATDNDEALSSEPYNIYTTATFPYYDIESNKNIPSQSYDYITARKNAAKAELQNIQNGTAWFITKDKIKRCLFIATDKSIASKYLTLDGRFLYAQSVKDHFELLFDVPDEIDQIKTHFETLLQDLVFVSIDQAMEIWNWCLDIFQPYLQYEDIKGTLTSYILSDIGNFPNTFPTSIIQYMNAHPDFIDKLILRAPEAPLNLDILIATALQSESLDTARRILACFFVNPSTETKDKTDLISYCIDQCANWKETKTMRLFRSNVFPIVYEQTDIRIKKRISEWEKSINQYIKEVTPYE